MVMLMKKSVLLVKAETTYDSDPTPTGAANALLVMNADIKETPEVIERDVQWKTLDRPPSILGEIFAELSFKIDMIGSGTAGTAPRIGALMKACGLSEAVVSATSVTYQVASSSHGSVTLYLYKDGRLHIITGARAKSAKMTFLAGKPLTADFVFQGRYAAPTVASLPGTVTYESTVNVPPVCKSSQFSYNSRTTLVTQTVELDFGLTLAKRPSLSDSNAIKGFEITDIKPTLSIDPESQVETSYTFRDDLLTTQRAVAVVATRAAGNIITLNVPKFNPTKIEYSDREGILVEKMEGECSANSGDDAFNIVFT